MVDRRRTNSNALGSVSRNDKNATSKLRKASELELQGIDEDCEPSSSLTFLASYGSSSDSFDHRSGGPSFPSFTSFSQIETEPDELNFLDSVPPEPQTATTADVGSQSPNTMEDRVPRLQTETNTHSSTTRPLTNKSNNRSGQRRRSSLISMIESIHVSMSLGFGGKEGSSVHQKDDLQQRLRQRRRSSLASMIESMQNMLFGFVNKEPSDGTFDNSSTSKAIMEDPSIKRRERRQQLKDSLVHNSQAVSQILGSTVQESSIRSSSCGPDETTKKTKKKKKGSKASMSPKRSKATSPAKHQVQEVLVATCNNPKSHSENSAASALTVPQGHDSTSLTLSVRSNPDLSLEFEENKKSQKSKKKKKGGKQKRSKTISPNGGSQSLSSIDFSMEPELLRSESEPVQAMKTLKKKKKKRTKSKEGALKALSQSLNLTEQHKLQAQTIDFNANVNSRKGKKHTRSLSEPREFPTPISIAMPSDPFSAPKPAKLSASLRETPSQSTSPLKRGRNPYKDAEDIMLLESSARREESRGRSCTRRRRRSLSPRSGSLNRATPGASRRRAASTGRKRVNNIFNS